MTVLRALGSGGDYGALVEMVDRCWRTAVQERGGSAEPSDVAALNEYTGRVLGALHNIATLSGFGPVLWEEQARDPYRALRDQMPEEAMAGLRPTVRGLLNAAWAVRLEQPSSPASVAALAQAAKRMGTPRRRSTAGDVRGAHRSREASTQRKIGHGALG
jgi:hypothetical protein